MKSNTPLKRTPFKPRSYDLAVQKQLSATGYMYPLKAVTLKKHSRSSGYKITIRGKEIVFWSLKIADWKWSLWIRQRDKKCLLCGKTDNLTNSHFYGRSNAGTRFHPDNCDTFCMECHTKMEVLKGIDQEYYLFKLNQIGKERMDILQNLSQSSYSRTQAIKEVMIFISKNPINNINEIQL